MRYTEYYNQPAPELGDAADITVVTDAILAGEKNQSGKVEFLKASISGNVISLTSASRTNRYVKHYDGLSVAFISPADITASDSSHTLKIDELAPQPFKIKTDIKRNDIIIATFNNSDGFITTNAPIPRSSATNSNSEVTVATSKAVNDLRQSITNRKIVAGNGLTGGGNLNGDVTVNVAASDDSITVSADGIKVNTYSGVDSTSTTRPASAGAVKTAYDKADTAQNTADKKVSKTGDTMTGALVFNTSGQTNYDILFQKNNSPKGELGHALNKMYFYNAKSQKSLSLFDDGTAQLEANNLKTEEKEVISSINSLYNTSIKTFTIPNSGRGKWTKLMKINPTTSIDGESLFSTNVLLTLRYSRANMAICNTFLITAIHPGDVNVLSLGDHIYSERTLMKIRIDTNSSGGMIINVYDDGSNENFAGTHYHISYQITGGFDGYVTEYTSYQDGSQAESGYTMGTAIAINYRQIISSAKSMVLDNGKSEVAHYTEKKLLGAYGIDKVGYIQDVGFKEAGRGYFDKITGKFYICLSRTNSQVPDDNFRLLNILEPIGSLYKEWVVEGPITSIDLNKYIGTLFIVSFTKVFNSPEYGNRRVNGSIVVNIKNKTTYRRDMLSGVNFSYGSYVNVSNGIITAESNGSFENITISRIY